MPIPLAPPADLIAATLDGALRGGVVVLLGLLGANLLRGAAIRRGSAAVLGALLALGLIVQVISSAPLFEAGVSGLGQAPWVAVSVGNAPLFWLFARALFDDEFVLSPKHGLIWLATALLSFLNCAWLAGQTQHWPLAAAAVLLQRLLPLLFGALIALTALRHWRGDLVERRRRLRAFVVIAGGAYMATMVAVRLQAPQGRLSGLSASLDMAGLLLITLVLAWGLLRLPVTGLLAAPPDSTEAALEAPLTDAASAPAVQETPDAAEQALLMRLQRLMLEERFYRSEDLTLARLAERMQLPEYRLRRLINQRLGQRNFSSFVNSYRVDEARAALTAPARRSTAVLTIALEAGFQSIGPFNRAFKAATGLTPSEYRQQAQADS
ncbi:helix-turn-helix domain-containing protein [Roseateles oligotrophus]|uniref:Helix-turn-helix domain-containing protein n=1 Tax=Roseateles oligotrophus TaxID=1769250 RepID=A0ABT2YKI8_9BURK|nr:AraC family transcriptional regulator [Roseateles oligotrophus]MCV2370571.1 helix-turn-helix domain-containing protein [Roseateles oligotrophus]